MPPYGALIRLYSTLKHGLGVIYGAFTPAKPTIPPPAMRHIDPHRSFVVQGALPGDPALGFSDLLWGYYDGGGPGPQRPPPGPPTPGAQRKVEPHQLTDARGTRQDWTRSEHSSRGEKVWVKRQRR